MLSREHCIRARSLRIEREGGVYHVINRGNYRQDLFVNEGAHQSFETCLFEACEKSGWVLEALLERGLRAARQTFWIVLSLPSASRKMRIFVSVVYLLPFII